MASLILALLLSTFATEIYGTAWSYTGPLAPEYWTGICKGSAQSPINIDTSATIEKELGELALSGFDLKHGAATPATIVNNGHSVQVNLQGDYDVSGAGLPSSYKAEQFHFHWGSVNTQGSEHTVDGQASSAEMHIVCYNSILYKSVTEAVTSNNPAALAVLSVLIEVEDEKEENDDFEPLVDALSEVPSEGDTATISMTFPLRNMMPKELDFYRYSGSLTTPPCNEIVTWTVFARPVFISSSQMSKFRALTTGEDTSEVEKLADNFRPVQPLNGRVVYYSKDKHGNGASGEEWGF